MPAVALSTEQQQAARNAAVQAATLAYQHEPAVHYTQGSQRWQGIANRLIASKGQYPNYADCSSLVTWAIWNGLYVLFGMEDVVNAASWQAGYTGTMLANGTSLSRASDMLPGDAVIYGAPGSTGAHTAIVVAAGSVPTVISHGSESGPYRLAYNYRSDIQSLRRYIDGKTHNASGGVSPAPPTPKPPTEDEIVGIATGVNKAGALHVFVEAKDGSVWYTWQKPGETSWNGGKAGVSTAKLQPFAPAPKS